MLNNLLKSLCNFEEQKVPESEPPSVPPSRSQFESKLPSLQDLKPIHPASVAPQSSWINIQGQQSGASIYPIATAVAPTNEVPPLSKEEKKILGNNIRKLSQKYLRGIIKIVSSEKVEGNTLEFDINKLSNKTNRELQKYVNDCFATMEKEKLENATNGLRKTPSTGTNSVNYR